MWLYSCGELLVGAYCELVVVLVGISGEVVIRHVVGVWWWTQLWMSDYVSVQGVIHLDSPLGHFDMGMNGCARGGVNH